MSDLEANKFDQFLKELLQRFSARAAAVWHQEESLGTMRRIAARGSGTKDPFAKPAAIQALPRLFAEAMEGRVARSLRLPDLFGGKSTTETLVIVAPLLRGESPVGLVVFLFDAVASMDEPALVATLSAEIPLFFGRMSNDASIAPEGRGLKVEGPETVPAGENPVPPKLGDAMPNRGAAPLLEFVLSLQRSLSLNDVSNVAVNDGRLLWGVDRVSLAVRRGRKLEVASVSGQESVHPRGNLVQLMRRLTDRVIATGDILRYDGSPGAVPPQLEEPLAEFIQESGARFLLIVPLIEPERLVPPEAPPGTGKVPRRERRTIGALVIEQMSASQPTPQLQQSLDLVTDHISAAIFNARNHSSIFLLPVWRAIGHLFEWLRGRRLAIAAAFFFALMAASVAMIVVPWEYRVEGNGRLMPVIQRDVFAPWDGQVTELMVQGGERVEVGQVLLKLRNDVLAAELVTVENELREKRKLVASLAAQRDDAEKKGDLEQALQLQGKSVEARVEIEGATTQQLVLKDRLEQLTIRAPLAGVVTTFQVEKLLLHRPVKRGEVLLEVMDDHGDWQLELEIAEHRVGRILNAQQARRAEVHLQKVGLDTLNINGITENNSSLQTGKPGDEDDSSESQDPNGLLIEYRLLTQPESSFFARLTRLSTRAAMTENEGSVLEAWATLDKSALPPCTIGAEVRARIGCGRSSLGDVLFGDVVEFIQRYLWW
jgi:biotin carboxyl carrier protein